MRRIPSTQALRALDSFARHGSVWRAAEELNLTRSAVSHQLRLLEREVGFTLLNRIGTKVELTEQGAAYAFDIRKALSAISSSAYRHANRGLSGMVTISCTPGFASSWLCTRLAAFHEMFPDVELTIVTPRRLDDVSNPEVDVFVAFGHGYWPDMEVELLVDVEFTPLCSPVLVNKIGGLSDVADLAKTSLLHLVDREDWGLWLSQAGGDPQLVQSGFIFSDMNLVYAAATSAQGVAMGDEFICRTAMESGQLVRLFDINITSKRSYYLVAAQAKMQNDAVQALISWLKAEVLKNGADASEN